MKWFAAGQKSALVLIPILVLSGCVLLKETPTQVGKTETIDDQGRKVTVYHVCENKRLPLSLSSRTKCHSEQITESYCYRSIGKIDCYEKPIPGRATMERGE